MKIDAKHLDYKSLEVTKERLKNKRVKCHKYNHALDAIVQNFPCFAGYLQLSEDGKYLSLFNKKPIIRPSYVQDPDLNRVLEERERY